MVWFKICKWRWLKVCMSNRTTNDRMRTVRQNQLFHGRSWRYFNRSWSNIIEQHQPYQWFQHSLRHHTTSRYGQDEKQQKTGTIHWRLKTKQTPEFKSVAASLSLELSLRQMQKQQTVGNGSSSSDTQGALLEITPAAHEWCPTLTNNASLC